MAVKMVELTSIDAKRFTKRGERIPHIRIGNDSTVTSVSVIDEKKASIEFRFTTNYGAVGTITFHGNLIYEGDAQDMANRWRKSINLPPNIASEIHTAIMQVCMPDAVVIAKQLNLPLPIPLPKISFKEPKTGKTKGGPEVA